MRERKAVSVVKSIIIGNGINGVCWVLFGVFQFFENIPCMILAIIFASCGIVVSFYNLIAKKEKEDEMAIVHIEKARNSVMQIWIFVLCIIGIVSLAITLEINIRYIFPFILGLTEFLICFFFIRYEKVGD